MSTKLTVNILGKLPPILLHMWGDKFIIQKPLRVCAISYFTHPDSVCPLFASVSWTLTSWQIMKVASSFMKYIEDKRH